MDTSENQRGILRGPKRLRASLLRGKQTGRERRGSTPEQRAAQQAVARRQQDLAAAFPKMPQRTHPDTPRQMARRLINDAVRAEFAREAGTHIDLPEGWGRAELRAADYQSAPWFLDFTRSALDALDIGPSTIPLADVPELLGSPATSDGYGLGLEAAADLASVLLTQAWHLEREMAEANDTADRPSRTLDDQLAGEAEALRQEASRTLVRIVTVPLDLKAVQLRSRRGERADQRAAEQAPAAEHPLATDEPAASMRGASVGPDSTEDATGAEAPAGGTRADGHAFRPGAKAKTAGGARDGGAGSGSKPDVMGKIRSVQEFANSPEGQQMMALLGVGAREAWRRYQQYRDTPAAKTTGPAGRKPGSSGGRAHR